MVRLRRNSAFSEYAGWPVDGDPALRWKGSASSETTMTAEKQRDPRNKGRMTGQKRPLKPKDIWTIRVRLQPEGRKRDLALLNLAIDSKLRGCDLVRLRVDDVFAGGRVRDRARWSRRRRAGRFSLRSPSRHGPRSASGWPRSKSAKVDPEFLTRSLPFRGNGECADVVFLQKLGQRRPHKAAALRKGPLSFPSCAFGGHVPRRPSL